LILLFVQTLFPGMWLSEINADSYKVLDDVPENNGKVCFLFWIACFDLNFDVKLSVLICLILVFAEVEETMRLATWKARVSW